MIKKTFAKIKVRLFSEISKFICKKKGKKFEILINLYLSFYSLFNKTEKIKVKFDNPNYFIIDEKKKYKFFPLERIEFYQKGLSHRGKSLKDGYLLNNIKFQDNDIIIDIGANNGDFYLCFKEKIIYYGYEPSPVVFLNLQYNVKNQNIYNLGLSNIKQNNIEFYLKDESGDSTFLPIKDYSKKILVNTSTLDEEIEKIQKPIKLIKLEAEGFEPNILYGLKKKINFVEYITIDCGFEGIDENSTISECCNYLIKNNFKMLDFNSPRIFALFKNLNFNYELKTK